MNDAGLGEIRKTHIYRKLPDPLIMPPGADRSRCVENNPV